MARSYRSALPRAHVDVRARARPGNHQLARDSLRRRGHRASRVRRTSSSSTIPQPGWVEHDPDRDLGLAAARGARRARARAGARRRQSRRSASRTSARRRSSGSARPAGRSTPRSCGSRARPWRSARSCARRGLEPVVRERTGLVVDAYFSATKLAWILDQVEGARERARARRARVRHDRHLARLEAHRRQGARDRLQQRVAHDAVRHRRGGAGTTSCSPRSTSRAQLLPEVRDSSGSFGTTDPELLGASVPIAGVAGDQQAALFGQACFEEGSAKNTYGTGCFMLMNTGHEPAPFRVGPDLDDRLGHRRPGRVRARGRGVRRGRGGAVAARRARPPAQRGRERGARALGARHRRRVRGAGVHGAGRAVLGSARRAARSSASRAAPTARTSCARRSRRSRTRAPTCLRCFERDTGVRALQLQVDGGATANDFLMQFQADVMGAPVRRPKVLETTALGAAYLAGLAVGFWKDRRQIAKNWQEDRYFEPRDLGGAPRASCTPAGCARSSARAAGRSPRRDAEHRAPRRVAGRAREHARGVRPRGRAGRGHDRDRPAPAARRRRSRSTTTTRSAGRRSARSTLAELRARAAARADPAGDARRAAAARIPFNLEIKSPPAATTPGSRSSCCDEIAQRAASSRARLFSSFSDSVLAKLRELEPKARLGTLVSVRQPGESDRARVRVGAEAVHLHVAARERDARSRDAHAAGLRVNVYTVDAPRGAAAACAPTASTGSSRTCPGSCATAAQYAFGSLKPRSSVEQDDPQVERRATSGAGTPCRTRAASRSRCCRGSRSPAPSR